MLEHEREAALARYRLLRPHLEEGVLAARVAREQGIVLRTAQRWLRRYREDGVVGLVRRPRADCGTLTFPPDLVRLIEGLALQCPYRASLPSTAGR